MTTTPRKKNAHKKARAISSGFLRAINTFVLTPRQGLADKRTSFRTVVRNHESDNSITICEIVLTYVHDSTLTCLSGVDAFQIASFNRPKNLWLSNRWRAEE